MRPLTYTHKNNSYIGPEFTKILEKPQVEYRQANLTVACEYIAPFIKIMAGSYHTFKPLSNLHLTPLRENQNLNMFLTLPEK